MSAAGFWYVMLRESEVFVYYFDVLILLYCRWEFSVVVLLGMNVFFKCWAIGLLSERCIVSLLDRVVEVKPTYILLLSEIQSSWDLLAERGRLEKKGTSNRKENRGKQRERERERERGYKGETKENVNGDLQILVGIARIQNRNVSPANRWWVLIGKKKLKWKRSESGREIENRKREFSWTSDVTMWRRPKITAAITAKGSHTCCEAVKPKLASKHMQELQQKTSKVILISLSLSLSLSLYLSISEVLFPPVKKKQWTHFSYFVSLFSTTTKRCKKVKLATVVEGDSMAPFSLATTPRCRGGHFSFPWIAPLYPGYVSYIAEC